QAIRTEYGSLLRNKNWSVGDEASLLPTDNIISTGWLFKTKRQSDGTILKRKARLVARGYTQIPGIDVHNAFAPVACLGTIRTIFSLAAYHDWPLFQMDVKSAFLQKFTTP
ncbi:unnamed protein product, partial [Choristocarpus tenellus]